MTESDFLQRVMAMRNQLYHVARAMLWNDEDAADAVQDAMLTAWKKQRSLRDEDRFEGWFMRLFINRCRDMQREQIRRRRAQEMAIGEEKGDAPGHGDALLALEELPDSLRIPAILHYVEGYSHSQIARILNIDREQVNTRLRQARRRMKSVLEEGEQDDE